MRKPQHDDRGAKYSLDLLMHVGIPLLVALVGFLNSFIFT